MGLDRDSENQLIKKINERIILEFLDWIILNRLLNESQGAYDIAEHIERHYHIHLNTCSIYKRLDKLKKQHYIKLEIVKKKVRKYGLTKEGKSFSITVLNSVSLREFIHTLITTEYSHQEELVINV